MPYNKVGFCFTVQTRVAQKDNHCIEKQPVSVRKCGYPLVHALHQPESPTLPPKKKTPPPPPKPKPGPKHKIVAEVTTHEETAPEVTEPEVTAPEATVPEVTAPEVNTQNVTTPKVITKELKAIPLATYNLLKPQINTSAAEGGLKIDVKATETRVIITLHGPEAKVMESAYNIFALVNEIKENSIEVSPKIIELLQQDTAMQELKKRIKEKFHTTHMCVYHGKLRVAIHSDDFDQAEQWIQQCFAHDCVNVSMTAEDFERWRSMVESGGLVALTHNFNEGSIHINGFRHVVEATVGTLMRLPGAGTTTEEIGQVSKLTYSLLQDDIMKTLHSEVSLIHEMCAGDRIKLILKGPQEHVYESAVRIQELLQSISPSKLQVPDFIIELLKDDRVLQELNRLLLEQNFCAVIYLDQQTVFAWCKMTDAANIVEFVKSIFSQEHIAIDDASRPYIGGEEWKLLARALQTNGSIVIDQSRTKITISGFKKAVEEGKESVHEMLKGKSVKTENIKIPNRAEGRFLEDHMKAEFDKIQESW